MSIRLLPHDLERNNNLFIVAFITAAATTAALLLLLLAAAILTLCLLVLVEDLVLLDKLAVVEDWVLLELEDDLVSILSYDLKVSDVVKKLLVFFAQKLGDAVVVNLQANIKN